MIVLDASVVVDLLLDVKPYAPQVRQVVSRHAAALAAPHLLDVEVAQVLRRFVMARAITAVRAREALEDLAALPIQRFAHLPFIERAFDFHQNLTVYDALYLALAEGLGGTLVTRDRAFSTIRRHGAKVTVVT